jgi:hypothetical protein
MGTATFWIAVPDSKPQRTLETALPVLAFVA